MIEKELETVVNDCLLDSLTKKGYLSEKKMAFYLNRKFFDNPDFHVFHNLNIRTVNDKGFFQIDHLVITRYCFIVIESKTCNSHLKYDANLQWTCFQETSQKWIGIKSPMIQAEMQGEALRKVLQENRVNIRKRFLNKQGGFLTLPIHTLVAVSDAGIIDYPECHEEYSKNVLKADLIPNRVAEIFDSYKNRDTKANIFIFDKAPTYVFPEEDIPKIIQYILSLHHVKPAYIKLEKVSLPYCKMCKEKLTIEYSLQNQCYESVCKKCGIIKKMNLKCQVCGKKFSIHKYNKFYIIGCATCDKYGKFT